MGKGERADPGDSISYRSLIVEGNGLLGMESKVVCRSHNNYIGRDLRRNPNVYESSRFTESLQCTDAAGNTTLHRATERYTE
jgi:hypothetical protein